MAQGVRMSANAVFPDDIAGVNCCLSAARGSRRVTDNGDGYASL